MAKFTITKRKLALIAESLVTIVAYGLTVTLMGLTLINPYWLIGIIFVVALATVPPAIGWWGHLTDLKNKYLNSLCHIVFVTGALTALFLSVNYFGRNTATVARERVKIEKVYSEKHYKSRRVGRNRYVRGDAYDVYYIDVAIPGGYVRSLQIEPKDFRRYHVGDSVTVAFAAGALGFTVLDR